MPSPGQSADPPSGTRDFLAGDVRRREWVFSTIAKVFSRYGFGPLQTPAFERLEVLTGKYGDEGDKLIFKILRRGEWEATGEADLALRYDLTVPLARVVAAYGSRLPSPYLRYAIAPVWRADRPGKGRFREFYQCDVDVVGSSSPLADAQVVCAVADALDSLGLHDFTFVVNARDVLHGLLEVYQVPAEVGSGVLVTLDKLDKLPPEAVTKELCEARGLPAGTAEALVADVTAGDAVERMRSVLASSERGAAGLAEVDRLCTLAGAHVGDERVVFAPRLVRGLDYYTGGIWEVVAEGMPGSIASGGRYDHLVAALGGPDVPAVGGSLGIERILELLDTRGDEVGEELDVACAVLDADTAVEVTRMAGQVRAVGLRVGVYLGSSGKLAKQLKWASERRARFVVLYGPAEAAAGEVTVRDMETGEQVGVPPHELAAYLRDRCAAMEE